MAVAVTDQMETLHQQRVLLIQAVVVAVVARHIRELLGVQA
jgi:hypothetical protein